MVRSVLEYGATLWDPYLQKEINMLEQVQRKALYDSSLVTCQDISNWNNKTPAWKTEHSYITRAKEINLTDIYV